MCLRRAAFLAAALSLSPAAAGTAFTGLTDFGDSYADTGAAPGGGIRILLHNATCPPAVSVYPSCRFTGSSNFVDTLQSIYHLPGHTNYAIGGARTDNTNTFGGTAPGFRQQLDAFAASGTRFSKTDLVALSIGGNDVSLMLSTDSIAQVQTRAATAAANAVAGVQELAAAGARNIAWLSAGSVNYFPMPPAGRDGHPLSAVQRDAWAHTYFKDLQLQLAPVARSGVRIFLFDFETLEARVAANPKIYGFASAGGCQAALTVAGCLTAPLAVQNTYFFFNDVHPSGAGMALIATYMANQIDAPRTVSPQGEVAVTIAGDFMEAAFDRLEALRSSPADEGWSVHMEGQHAARTLKSGFYGAGYDYVSEGITAGVEYRFDQFLAGAQFGYASPRTDFDVQSATNRAKAYQFALYGSFSDSQWFADALVAYGRQDWKLERLGVLDVLDASPGARTAGVAARGGYLFTVGALSGGPLAALRYVHAGIDGYAESGDQLLAMTVDRQSFDTLTGEAGLTLRYPFSLGSTAWSLTTDVTVAQDLTGYDRFVTTAQQTAPLIGVPTPVPDRQGTYGRITAAIGGNISTSLSADIHLSSSFARRDGDDLTIGGGIRLTP